MAPRCLVAARILPFPFVAVTAFWVAGLAVTTTPCDGWAAQSGSDCVEAQPQSLREAAAGTGVRVGVAAAPGDPEAERLLLEEFDAVSAEGELLWRVIHPTPEEWNFEPADRLLSFTFEHGLETTVTHFVWDQAVDFSGTPAWVKEIANPDELRTVMRQHLSTLSARYGERIDRWIVVNEPFNYLNGTLYENHFYRVLGPDYIAETFRIASEAAPHSQLWLNEILVEYSPPKAAALVALARDLVERGVPIDGVSLQGHLFLGEPSYRLIRSTMREIGDLGLATAITELDAPMSVDVPDRLEVQARQMAGMVEACLGVAACNSVTWWGLHDGISWINWLLGPDLVPLLFDASLTPKPAYFAVRDALERGRPLLTAERLVLRDPPASAGLRRLRVVSRDPSIALGRGDASPDDPVIHGGTLRVVSSSGDGFDASYLLPAGGWDYVRREGQCRGYRFRSTGSIRTVRVKAGKALSIYGRGAELAHSLSNDPGHVSVALSLGERRHCMTFGGTVRFRAGRSFRAWRAPLAASCPEER